MLQTFLGTSVEKWSDSAKADMKTDLNKLTTVPQDLLRTIADEIARTHPCCNPVELAAFEAEKNGIADPQDLIDAVAGFAFVWAKAEQQDTPLAITKDLLQLDVISQPAAQKLRELLTDAQPFKETADVTSNYLRIGTALFGDIRGTVDIRCRFHKTSEEFVSSRLPQELIDTYQVIITNVSINHPNGNNDVVAFLMDEKDLAYMKRFVRNMERELELTKHLLVPQSGRTNVG
ncbi:MAG TPA: hypothetical protein VJW20_06220 [Candidatus Angelobacter sp.]|nr:hypothetical protein [Candidatus Angelobacter sp.]